MELEKRYRELTDLLVCQYVFLRLLNCSFGHARWPINCVKFLDAKFIIYDSVLQANTARSHG